jgi:hypothetical protein
MEKSQSRNEQIRKYLCEEMFADFRLCDGELFWNNGEFLFTLIASMSETYLNQSLKAN